MGENITAICQECKKQFEYDLKPGYPRKYCFECSQIKKATFAGKQQDVPVVPIGKAKTDVVPTPRAGMIETQIHINKHERANSYEFGKAGNRFKLYFEDATDLELKIKELKDAKLYSEEFE